MAMILYGLLLNFVVYASPYSLEERIAYIENSLQAFAVTSQKSIQNTQAYIGLIDRSTCRSSYERLRVSCLKEAAEQSCKQTGGVIKSQRCRYISDTLVTNKLSESKFISSRQRYAIMKKHNEFRQHVNLALGSRYSIIAVKLATSENFDCKSKDTNCLANKITHFCQVYAPKNNISWQHCSSALIWHIGTSKE